jgi:hypothetical protein
MEISDDLNHFEWHKGCYLLLFISVYMYLNLSLTTAHKRAAGLLFLRDLVAGFMFISPWNTVR